MQIKLRMKGAIFPVLAIFIAAGFFVFRSLARSEEDAIIRRLNELASAASLDGREPPLRAAARANDIVEFFTPEIQISAHSPNVSISTRRELRQLAFQSRTSLDYLSVRVRRSRIELDPDELGAVMDVSLEIRVRGMNENRRDREGFTIRWVKREGVWMIDRVERYETIRTVEPVESGINAVNRTAHSPPAAMNSRRPWSKRSSI